MGDMASSAGPENDPLMRTVKVKGVEQKARFAELSFYDRRELLRAAKEEEKRATKEMLDDAQADQDTRLLEMGALMMEKVGENQWIKFFNSDDGKIEILKASLKKQGAEDIGPVVENLMGGVVDIAQLCAAITHTYLKPMVTMDEVEEIVKQRLAEVLGKDGNGTPGNPEETGIENPTKRPKTSSPKMLGFGKI
jgi:hypothetical protein